MGRVVANKKGIKWNDKRLCLITYKGGTRLQSIFIGSLTATPPETQVCFKSMF